MRKYFIKLFAIFIILFSFKSTAFSINNKIIIKVGNNVITSYELKNEITFLILSKKREINQIHINDAKPIAVQNLIRQKLKENEIKKYSIKNYNKNDLDNILKNISKLFDTDIKNLSNVMSGNGLDYDLLTNKYKTDLKWNSLIFLLYKDQLTIDNYEIDLAIKSLLKDKKDSQINYTKIKNQLIERAKIEKLELFSRSHFTNIENSTLIKFNE